MQCKRAHKECLLGLHALSVHIVVFKTPKSRVQFRLNPLNSPFDALDKASAECMNACMLKH